ncbi:MAG: InlB B-repeat-containing protein [Paludibacteraceae bacterium]|nr:InlB B-repeat-containing protein [Paludibacteraceae bacterium]
MANISMAWGASPFTIEAPDQITYTQDGITVSGQNTTATVGGSSSQKVYNTTYASVHIFSQSTNITGISFKACYTSSYSGDPKPAITLQTSTGGVFSVLTSSDYSISKDNASPSSISLTNLGVPTNTSSVTYAITFNSPVKAIELTRGSNAAVIRDIEITYNTPSSYTTYYAASIIGSSNDDGSVTTGPTGATVTFDHSTSSQATINTKKYDKMEGNQVINLGTGNTFQVGDQIILDICSSGNNATTGGIIDLTGGSDPTISVVTSKAVPALIAYVVVANDGIAGQTSATTGKVGTTSYIHGITVLRAAAACETLAAPTGLTCVDQSYNTMSFSWDAVANASSYDVKLWTNSTCTGDPAKSANTTNTTCRIRDLSSSTTYYCKVQTKGDGSTYCTSGGTTATAASGTTDSETRVFKSGETVFFKDADNNIGTLNRLWVIDGGNVYAYFYNSNDDKNWASGAGTVVRESHHYGNAIYKFTVPKNSSGEDHEWSYVIFTRGTAATWDSGFWNQTQQQSPNQGENMFTISKSNPDGSGYYSGSWSTYANGAAVVGDMNNWRPDGGEFNYSGSKGTVYMDLEANTEYKFKVLDGTGWKGCGGTITNTTTSWWKFNTDEDCTVRTGEEGNYAFKWDNSGDDKYLGIYYPQARLKKGEYIYFDARDNSTWTASDFDARFWFKYYDSNANYPNDVTYHDCAKSNAKDSWVYPYVVPNSDCIGQVQMNRIVSGSWNADANKIEAHTRTSSKQNCIKLNSSDASTSWTTYCPPMTTPTLSDNSTTTYGGSGTEGSPYLVEVGTSINVQATGSSSSVPDPDMTAMYDFKVGGSTEQNTTSTTFTYTASTTHNTTHTLTVDAYNTYNETNSTKNTSSALYYKAVTIYDIAYKKGANGTGTEYTDKKIKGTNITLRGAIFTRTGYTQTGWATSDGGAKVHNLSATYSTDAALTLYPVWTAKTTAITLDKNNSDVSGSTSGSVTATYGSSSLTSLIHATRTGYTQNGYETSGKVLIIKPDGTLNTSKDGYTLGSNWINESSSLTLYARWSATSYTLSYDLAGGSVESANPTSYTIESSAITLNNPTKTGYTFAGWTGTGLAEATTTVTIAAGSTGNRSYTATWTAIVPSSVSLNKTSTTIEIEGTETLTATISPEVVADNTITWTSSDETVATVTSAGVVTGVKAGTATITATTHNDKTATCAVTVAPAVTYTVTYVYNGADGGSQPASATGASVTLPEPTKTGYELEGWYTTAGAKVDDGGETYSPTANITLYARWTETCSGGGGGSGTEVRFLAANKNDAGDNFASMAKDATQLVGSGTAKLIAVAAAALNDADKAIGYRADAGKMEIVFKVDATSTLDIYVNQNGSSDRTYQLEGFTSAKALSLITPSDYTSSSVITTNVSVAGASFSGAEGTTTAGSATVSDGVITITGKGGVKISYTSLAAGYYVFKATGSSSEYIYGYDLTPAGGSLSACHKVLYHGNGATSGYIYDPAVYDDDDDPTVLGNVAANGVPFVRSGYTFLGWDEDEDVTTPTYTAASIAAGTASITNIDADVDLYAIWEEEEDETTYYLVTSTAQLNTTDTYVIMDDGKNAMMGVATDDNAYLNAITSGFTAAADKSTVTVTSSDVNTLTLQAESSAWNIVGKNDKKLSTKGTVDGKLYANTAKATSSDTDDFVFSFADGKVTIKRNTSTDYNIYYSSGTGFNQSQTATNIRLYTSNSTPVDVTAPTLISSDPADEATGVGVSGNIELTFSENVTINDASKFTLTGGAGTLNTASASASGAVVTIPYTGLAYNTTYTLATAAEAVKDGSNNKNAAFDITFTTLSATGSCNELNYVWAYGSTKTPKGNSVSYYESDTATINNSNVATTHITISGTNYAQTKKGKGTGSLNLAKAKDNYFLLTAASGYVIDSVYFYGKLEDGQCRMSTDGSAWTTTLGDGSSTGEKVYAIGVGTQYFGLKNNDEDSPSGVWIRTMMVKVCPAGTTYTVNYDANGHGSAPDAETDITPGSTISAPDEPTADCWTFNGWYKDRACTNVWNFAEDEVNSNITLYAKWTSNKARVKGLDYGETDYTVDPAGIGDAITVTPVSASGVTYKWYSNTSDDVTGWSEIPSAETASYSPSIASVGTTYYWAVLVHECGNDTTSSVRINVAASKTDPTIAWGNVQLSGVNTTPTYGGGGYTLTGTINAGAVATPTLTTDMISADGGIVITAKSVNDAGKTFSLTFDVTAAFDTTQAKITNIHFSLPSNAMYNDSVFSTNLSFDKCSGGSYSTDVYVVGKSGSTGMTLSSAAKRAFKTTSTWRSTASPSFTEKTSADGFTISASEANYYWKQSNQTIVASSTGATMKLLKLANSAATITWTNSSLSLSKIRIIGINYNKTSSTFTVSNGTDSASVTYAAEETAIKEVTLNFVHGSDKGVRFTTTKATGVEAIIELVPTGSDGAGTGTATALQWKSGKAPSNISGWDGEKIVKAQSDDDFTCVAEQTSATNSVGAITYASDNTDVATVNETTGEVDIVAGAAGGEATITATMARSGCFMRSTISYTISVPELACAIEPGTLSASATSKCKTADVTLTLSDYTTAGTTLQWYKSGTAEPLTDGDTYDIGGATLTTAQEGTYYAKVTLEETGCSLSSNNVTITNKGGAASVSKLVNQWYIKKGRVTPDIALWRLGEGSSYVANSAKAGDVALTDQLGGCTVIARDSTIYLSGGDPTGISAVGDVSLTVQVQDECGNTTTSDTITIHKQVATDKHELAFVTTGTNYEKKEFTEDAWTAGIKAANSTGLALYQVLKDTFKIQATNIYASDDEKKIREYYSQYDLICITDYPNTGTKGKNKKSYVDAIGSLIDIRPVLTMEAWVSGLDNWRNKGAVGTRTTPSKRQYNMYLQCKDHEMFEGVTMQQIGYGDDALFKVNMVDSTQSRYEQLDAVGKDSHATDTAALQGFTTGDMDLLAIGLIDNGSGTNLQVGAERQNVMTARMMILGVNSYAMERLSEDGMRVIVNALQYLTKKRAEDISDCSTYFTNAGGDNRWENPANWRSGTLPYSNQEARILQPVVVSDTRKIASVKIVADGTFQDAEARGRLTIAPTGALIVNSMIQSATGPDVFSGYPTEISHLTIQTDELHQGALIFDNSNGETQATVNLYSKAYNDGSYKFQYFASPFMDLSSWAFDAYIYTHDESLDVEWTELRYGEDVSAFQGLAITADGAARNYTIDGTLASTNPHTFNLTYTSGKANNKKGSNVIGNSWSAPIQITRIDDSDFSSPSNFEGIIYIYNAGRDVLVDGKVHASEGNSEPGQWQSIPIETAKTEEWAHERQIPAFQAFQMKVNAATEFTLDYDKHVRQEASVGVNNYNEPLHAPSRSMRAEEIKVLRLCVEDAQVGKSYIYLCEGDEFTEERDRGWEAKQTIGSGKYGKLYAIDQARDYMMSIARPSLEGTPVGFICGQSTEYTISFNETDGTYYLNDLEKQQSTLIQEGESYTFTTTKGNHPNRFIISATPFEAPSVATGMTNLDAAAPKVQKIIYNDKLYIIRGGKVYSADGQVVK